jgi:hypothetical protein
MAQVVEYLLCKLKALSLNPILTKKSKSASNFPSLVIWPQGTPNEAIEVSEKGGGSE